MSQTVLSPERDSQAFEPSASWPPAHVERLKELWPAGASAAQIARKLAAEFPNARYSRNAVIGKVHRLKLSHRNLPSRPKRVAAGLEFRSGRTPQPKAPKIPKPNLGSLARNVVRRAAAGKGDDYAALRAAPVDATLAKPWTERAFGECAYIIANTGADAISCCQPTAATYCKGHSAIMFYKPTKPPENLQRLAKRYAA